MRVYPHLQDTGGFFITVFEKTGDAEPMAEGMIRAMASPSIANSISSAEPAESTSLKRPAEDADGSEPALKRAKNEDGDADPVGDEVEPTLDAETPAEPETNVKVDKHAADKAAAKARERDPGYGLPGGTPYKEDPFAYADPQNDQVLSCV